MSTRRLFSILALTSALATPATANRFIAVGSVHQCITPVICDANGEPNQATLTPGNFDLYIQQDGHVESAKIDLVAKTAGSAWNEGHAYSKGHAVLEIDIPDANLAADSGSSITYIIVDPVTHNSICHYEVHLSPPVDVKTVLGSGPAGVVDMQGAVRFQNAAAITPADCNAESLTLAVYELYHALTADAATTVATDTNETTFRLTAGSAANDYYNGRVVVVEDASDSNRRASGIVSDYTGATKEIILSDGLPFTPAANDPVYIQTIQTGVADLTSVNNRLDDSNDGLGAIKALIENVRDFVKSYRP